MFFVVPCYNEAESLGQMATLLIDKIEELAGDGMISPESRILFVDDGSRDSTWSLICDLAENSPCIKGLSLQENYGQQLALYAGITEAVDAGCDAVITMDADGQHDLDAVNEMVMEFTRGCDVVCGVRSDRKSDSLLKKVMVHSYYALSEMAGLMVLRNHADFRLMSRKAIELYDCMPKKTIYLRGAFPFLPLQCATVKYDCGSRFSGETKYSVKKNLRLGIDGLISHGMKPAGKIGLAGLGLVLAGSPLLASERLLAKTASALPMSTGGGLLYLAGASLARHLEKDKTKYVIKERV